ncbi:hypothetical protein FBU30_001860, partial [Linnemannia zychae]
LNPPRIAALPGIVLDVIVKDDPPTGATSTISRSSVLKTPPVTPQTEGKSIFLSPNDVTISRRNPSEGLVEEAMEGYRHMEPPITTSQRRGPQAIPDTALNTPPISIKSPGFQLSGQSRNARTPQESISSNTVGLEAIMAKAANGDLSAQVTLGGFFQQGINVQQNFQTAIYWYLEAANQGYPHGQRRLGYLYQQGTGVPRDYSVAMAWFRMAADQGDASAQRNIGSMYYYGQGVTPDYDIAMKWYLEAGEQGDAAAQYAIGLMYHSGHGVTIDLKLALEWYLKSANQGYAQAQCNIGYFYGNGEGVPKDWSKALDWYVKAADQGNIVALYNILLFRQQGRSSQEQFDKAYLRLKEAADS